jgi:TrmH family RNA methyltransferase
VISKNQIKYIQSLHSKKNRDQEGLFIIEGVKLVTEFITHEAYQVIEVFATSEYLNKQDELFKGREFKITELTSEELQKISLLTSPNQVLAIARMVTPELDISLLNNSTTLFLDDIRDPGNLGTMIRIADWFGIKQVICSPTSTELYNPKTVQASMGAILRVSVLKMSIQDLAPHLKEIPVYGAVLTGKNIYTSSLSSGLLVIGNESNGISAETLTYVNAPITIPPATSNGSESLNAANACAIICSEFHRQLNYST